MSKIFVTADLHLGHQNIIKYCNRPFGTYHQMDSALIKNFNSVVSDEDTVFILGDFTMSRNRDVISDYLGRMNGNKHLILGNHDRAKAFCYVDCGFQSVHTSFPLPEHNLIMAHDPSVSDACKALGFEKILCGHVHGLFTFQNKVLNVGLDVHNYFPISLEKALSYFVEQGQK
jgi:calcineurin-like phosphoesterase family protein